VPLARLARNIIGRRRNLQAPAAAVFDVSEPNDQVRGAPSRGSLLAGLDGAAGSRGIESIHIVDRTASSVLYAMSP
jgi:hypothetical protein